MAIYEWKLAACDDERMLELNLVSTRRRGEVSLRSADGSGPTLIEASEVRMFLASFERVSLRRTGQHRAERLDQGLEPAAV